MDRLDRASTLNFTVVARVGGHMTDVALRRSLRLLERKHPLLRARIARRWGWRARFMPGEAAEIPLRIEQGSHERGRALAESSLMHRRWADEGPRAELTWVQHEAEESTLVFCMQHIVGDGLSAMVALRDLLSFMAQPDAQVEPVESSGIDAFLPTWSHALRQWLRATLLQLLHFLPPWPRRLRAVRFAAMRRRQVRLDSVQLDAELTASLSARARRDGASLHGVLCAAVALAVARALGGRARQRILHPLDMRRYLPTISPDTPTVGEAVGCYAVAVHTDHRVAPDAGLAALATEISQAVRREKALGTPLLVASHLGPSLVCATRLMDSASFRLFAESALFPGTFSLSNLGAVDALGLSRRMGDLDLKAVSIVSAGSVMHSMTLTALTFQGALDVQLCSVQPFIPPELAAKVMTDAGRTLRDYASEVVAPELPVDTVRMRLRTVQGETNDVHS